MNTLLFYLRQKYSDMNKINTLFPVWKAWRFWRRSSGCTTNLCRVHRVQRRLKSNSGCIGCTKPGDEFECTTPGAVVLMNQVDTDFYLFTIPAIAGWRKKKFIPNKKCSGASALFSGDEPMHPKKLPGALAMLSRLVFDGFLDYWF